MNANPWTITAVKEGTRFDARNRPYVVKLIQYTVGNNGPFTLTVEPSNDTPAWITAALAQKAADLAAIGA